MSPLTNRQREALNAYEELAKMHPELFSKRVRRPILRDRRLLEDFEERNDCVLGVAATTSYSYFVVDLVESTDAHGNKLRHPYQRLIDRAALAGGTNTVVVATIADSSLGRIGDIVLVEQERHATGKREIGLPRGFGKPGLLGEENALAELREETGYSGVNATRLATVYIDSGLSDATVTFFHVPVTRWLPSAPEAGEAIITTRLLPQEAVWQEVISGHIQDSFTIQGLALFQRHGMDL